MREEEIGLRFQVEWEDQNAVVRSRESAFGAMVLHLAVVVMVLISPRGASGFAFLFPGPQPFELVELVPVPGLTPLYVPPGAIETPRENTPNDLTDEERERLVLRTPGGEKPEPGKIFSLPQASPTPPGGGEPDAQEALVAGGAGGEEGSSSAEQDAEGEDWEDPEREVALLDIPRPSEPTGALDEVIPRPSPNRALQEALRKGLQERPGGFVGRGQEGWVSDPNLNVPVPTILSDQRGVDFSPYLARVLIKVRRNWHGLMPDSVRLGERGSVVLVFTIVKNGDLEPGDPQVVASSGRSHLDRPALAAVQGAEPFSPLPEAFTGNFVKLQFTFLYNIPIEAYGSPSR